MMDLASTVAKLVRGSTLSVPPGTYAGDITVKVPDVVIRAQPGTVVIRGGDFGVRILDGVTGCTIDGLAFVGQKRNPVYVKALCHRTTVQNCRMSGMHGSGILTANAHDVLIQGCLCENGDDHGVYASQSGDRGRILGNTVRNCAASGIQVNAHQSGQRAGDPSQDGLSDGWIISGNTIEGSGSKGGSGLNLLGLINSEVSDNTVRGQKGGGGIAIDADAGGGKPCYGLILQRNHVSAPHHGILIGKGSLACTVDASNQIVGNPQTDYREHVKTT